MAVPAIAFSIQSAFERRLIDDLSRPGSQSEWNNTGVDALWIDRRRSSDYGDI
jgi:hypothetical protein